MDKIYKFDEFAMILESMGNNDEELLRAIEKVVSRKSFVQWITSPDFNGLYTRPSKEYPGLEEIVCRWGNYEYTMYNILYKDGDFYFTWREKLPKSEDPFYFEHLKHLKGMFKSGDRDYFEDVKRIIEHWLWEMGVNRSIEEINPFEHGVENMPIIKELESNGMKIVSTLGDKEEGILVLRFPDAVCDYIITPWGDIKRKKHGGKGSSIIVNREELLKRIYGLDDLIPKLKFVYQVYLLDLAKSKDLPEELYKKILLILGTGEGIKDPSYREEYDKVVKNNPEMALYLPEPEGGGNEELIKGARIINRLGLF